MGLGGAIQLQRSPMGGLAGAIVGWEELGEGCNLLRREVDGLLHHNPGHGFATGRCSERATIAIGGRLGWEELIGVYLGRGLCGRGVGRDQVLPNPSKALIFFTPVNHDANDSELALAIAMYEVQLHGVILPFQAVLAGVMEVELEQIESLPF